MKRPGTSLRSRQRHSADNRRATGRRPARLTREQVLTAYAELRRHGFPPKRIADLLGYTGGGLRHHLAAARRAGDPRAPYIVTRRAAA